MRLIDADDLKKTYYRELNIEPKETGACYIAFGMFPRMIDNAKTINIEKARLGMGDLISRRKALEALTVTEEMDTAELLWLLTTRINDLPTIEPMPDKTDDEVITRYENDMVAMTYNEYQDLLEEIRPIRHGRWVEFKSTVWDGGGAMMCSCCNYGYAHGAFFEVENFNYCPNCGAKMEEDDE